MAHPLRWGIVSAGKISHDFTNAVSTLPEENHKIIAVAARDLNRAKDFAKMHSIPKAYQDYKSLAEDGDIDIIYVGCLNPQHFEVVKMILEHNKHVLCEKPMTLNQKQTKSLIELARSKNLFLMEAIWSRTFPVYKELRKQLDSGSIGEVKYVHASFGFNLSNVDRLTQKELGGGTILDLGVYTLQFQQYVFGKQKPLNVTATGHLNKNGVDDCMAALITYPNGQIASISTSAMAEMPNEGVIVGTKGIIRVPDVWCPTKLILPNEIKEFPLSNTAKHPYNFHNSTGLAYEAEEVRQCIQNGLKENNSISLDESLQLAEWMDMLRNQLGVQFSED